MFILWQYHKQWPTLPFDGIWLKMDNTIYEFHSHLIYAALVRLMQFKLISPAWNHSNKSYSNEIWFHHILEFTNNAIGSFDIGLYLVWPELHMALKNSDFFQWCRMSVMHFQIISDCLLRKNIKTSLALCEGIHSHRRLIMRETLSCPDIITCFALFQYN